MRKLNIVAIICAILLCVVYVQCKTNKPADPRGPAYAGSAKCMKCHSDVYGSYLHTAHFVASVPANLRTIHGSFLKGSNAVDFSASQQVVMEKRDSGLFQTYYLNGKLVESHRFDIVLGGVKGESYLYWHGNGLNQLPISYFAKQNKWLLSPRYRPGQVDFNRTITARCLECHASYIGDADNSSDGLNAAEQFDKASLVLSVDCERCHGPAADHVAFQTENPQVKTAKYITIYKTLSRTQKMDMCGVCHSGNKAEMLRSTFAFKPGDTLAKFKLPEFMHTLDTAHLDVHGNQLQLLESSKCFINSKMDCASCHNTHQNQRGNTAMFTQKCLNCHSTVTHNYCKLANTVNAAFIKSNCIQCHMPAMASGVIMASKNPTGEILVHTHHIAIYPQEVKKILAYVGK